MNDEETKAAAQANGWTIEPMYAGDIECAYAARIGSEVHFKVVDGFEHRAIQRRRMREFVAGVQEKAGGMLTTRVPLDDKKSQLFVARLGFEPTWSDENFVYYMLTALPFER